MKYQLSYNVLGFYVEVLSHMGPSLKKKTQKVIIHQINWIIHLKSCTIRMYSLIRVIFFIFYEHWLKLSGCTCVQTKIMQVVVTFKLFFSDHN